MYLYRHNPRKTQIPNLREPTSHQTDKMRFDKGTLSFSNTSLCCTFIWTKRLQGSFSEVRQHGFRSYKTGNKFIQNITIFKFFPHCILFSLVFEILLKHSWYLNLQLDGNINSPPIAYFILSNVVLRH